MMRAVVLLLAALLGAGGCGSEKHDGLAGAADLKCRASKLRRTIVTPHLEQPLKPGVNVLWCATAQIAWNDLCKLVGGDIHMEPEDPMVAVLNKKAVTRTDLDETTCVSLAGVVGDGVLDRITQQLETRFRGAASPKLVPEPGSLPPGVFVAYAYLFADLPFEWAFERLKRPLKFKGKDVACFGIMQYLKDQKGEAKAAEQLLIHDFRNELDFIIELKTELAEHRLLLAKVPAEATLAATVAAVRERVAKGNVTKLEELNDFIAPILNFDLTRDYREVMGRPLKVPDARFNGMPIEIARQQIRFRLDERGAVLKSEAIAAGGEGQNLILDRASLILIEYAKGSMPYFALWVDNAELLVDF